MKWGGHWSVKKMAHSCYGRSSVTTAGDATVVEVYSLIVPLVTWPKVKPGGQLDPIGISWAKTVHAENGQGYGPVGPQNVSRWVWHGHSRDVGYHDFVVHRYCWQAGVGSITVAVVPVVQPKLKRKDVKWMTDLCQLIGNTQYVRKTQMSDARMLWPLVGQSCK